MNSPTLLSIAAQTPGGPPPLIVGGPGIAKTRRTEALARWLDLHCETVLGSIREPSDFGGLPIPDNGHGVRLEAPAWAKRLAEATSSMLFLDEVSTCAPAVQAALLRVVLDRWVGDLRLPDSCRIVLGANPTEEAAGGWDLAPPLVNRVCWIKWTAPSVEAWSEWLLGGGEAEDFVKVDQVAWEREWPTAKAIVSGFLRSFPQFLNEGVRAAQGRTTPSFGSPRSWEGAARLIASALAVDKPEAMLHLVAGCCGDPAGIAFAEWYHAQDLPDPEDLIADPDSWIPDPKRQDRTYTVLTSVAAAAIRKDKKAKERGKRWESAWRVLGRTMGQGKDLVLVSARTLARNRPEGGMLSPEVKGIVAQLSEVMVASGLMDSGR